MDKKSAIAIVLCSLIFILWQKYYLKPVQYSVAEKQTVSTLPTSSETGNKNIKEQKTIQALTIKTEHAPKILLGNKETSQLEIFTLGGLVKPSDEILFKNKNTSHLNNLIGGEGQLELSTPYSDWSYLSKVQYSVALNEKQSEGIYKVVLVFEDKKVKIERTYLFDSTKYSLSHKLDFETKEGTAPQYLFVNIRASKEVSKELSENEKRLIYLNRSGGQDNWQVKDIDSVKEDANEVHWIGISSRYFLNALVNKSTNLKPLFQTRPSEENAIVSMIYKVETNALTAEQVYFYGPKERELLRDVGKNLEHAVDFGWFTIIALPLLTILKWLYKFCNNYGIAIIVLTVLVKLILYPLTFKSMKSMKEMQRIQPQLARLREKYKDDKEALNREMLNLMKSNGYNPLSGCLPIFVQMPFFVALYNVLFGAIDLYGQPFFGWIHDLSMKDPFYVTPILLGLMMFIQQKLTPSTATDPAQEKMMHMMPLIFSFMMLWLPSGLTLYMLVNSIVSVIQQIVLNKKFGIQGAAAKPA